MHARNLGRAVLAAALCAVTAALHAAAGSATYTYDDIGRVIAVIYEDGTGQVYSYDNAGNRKTSFSGTPVLFSVPATGNVNKGSAITLTVTKANNAGASATVNYAIQPGTAVLNTNYTVSPTSGTLSFAANQTTQTLSVQTVEDHLYDGPITFSLVLTPNSSNGAISQELETVTINETDPVPVFSVAAVVANEGSPLNFSVTRSNATSLTQTVNYATADGTALNGTDYTAASGILSFAPSSAAQTAQTVQVSSIGDTLYEGNRSFSFGLSNATNLATISGTQGSATGTVNDDDTPPSLAINSPAAVNATLPITFTVNESFSGSTTGTRNATTVNYATADGSAIAGTNYTAASGGLSFPGGSTGNQGQNFTVTTLGPTSQNTTVSFTASISGANNSASITTATGTGTINPSGNNVPTVPSISPTSLQRITTNFNYSVSWTASAYNPTSYKLWETSPSNTLLYTGTALSHSGTVSGNGGYTFEVQACNAYGCSALSSGSPWMFCYHNNC